MKTLRQRIDRLTAQRPPAPGPYDTPLGVAWFRYAVCMDAARSHLAQGARRQAAQAMWLASFFLDGIAVAKGLEPVALPEWSEP